MNTTPCRGCGKPIVWGITPEGKRIPLDPRAPTYYIAEEHADGRLLIGRAPAMKDGIDRCPVLVSHFATCPKAADFSGSRRKAE